VSISVKTPRGTVRIGSFTMYYMSEILDGGMMYVNFVEIMRKSIGARWSLNMSGAGVRVLYKVPFIIVVYEAFLELT